MPWPKGRPRSKQEKIKISSGLKQAYREGRRKPVKLTFTEELRKKLSEGIKRAYREGRKKPVRYNLGRHLPLSTKLKLSRYPRPKLVFELKPSPHLSYVIGAIFGDGTVRLRKRNKNSGGSHPQYRIVLSVKDKDFIDEFNRRITKVVGRKQLYSIQFHGGRYHLVCSSKILFEPLNGYNLERVKPFVDKYPREFIRGFADAEGSVHYVPQQHARSIRITNSNKELLEYIQNLLAKHFSIKSKIYGPYKGRNALDLIIFGLENIKRFYEQIGFSIGRKNDILRQILNGSTPN